MYFVYGNVNTLNSNKVIWMHSFWFHFLKIQIWHWTRLNHFKTYILRCSLYCLVSAHHRYWVKSHKWKKRIFYHCTICFGNTWITNDPKHLNQYYSTSRSSRYHCSFRINCVILVFDLKALNGFYACLLFWDYVLYEGQGKKVGKGHMECLLFFNFLTTDHDCKQTNRGHYLLKWPPYLQHGGTGTSTSHSQLTNFTQTKYIVSIVKELQALNIVVSCGKMKYA